MVFFKKNIFLKIILIIFIKYLKKKDKNEEFMFLFWVFFLKLFVLLFYFFINALFFIKGAINMVSLLLKRFT